MKLKSGCKPIKPISNDEINRIVERERAKWIKVAKKNKWYKENFKVIVWICPESKNIKSSSHRGLKEDEIHMKRWKFKGVWD